MSDSLEVRERPARQPRPRLAAAFCVTALLLVVAGTVGTVNPGDRVWTGRILDHPYVFGVLAACAAAAAVAVLFPERPGVTIFGSGACLAVALVWGMVGLMSSSFAPEDVATVSAPAGQGVDFEVVVRDAGIVDPAWTISVRQRGRGLLDTEWYVGCISDRATGGAFDHVEWKSRSRLLVVTRDGAARVEVSPETGEPQRPVGEMWHSC